MLSMWAMLRAPHLFDSPTPGDDAQTLVSTNHNTIRSAQQDPPYRGFIDCWGYTISILCFVLYLVLWGSTFIVSAKFYYGRTAVALPSAELGLNNYLLSQNCMMILKRCLAKDNGFGPTELFVNALGAHCHEVEGQGPYSYEEGWPSFLDIWLSFYMGIILPAALGIIVGHFYMCMLLPLAFYENLCYARGSKHNLARVAPVNESFWEV
jgi:hypothetical protein